MMLSTIVLISVYSSEPSHCLPTDLAPTTGQGCPVVPLLKALPMPDHVMIALLKREHLLTGAKLHALAHDHSMLSSALNSLKAQLRKVCTRDYQLVMWTCLLVCMLPVCCIEHLHHSHPCIRVRCAPSHFPIDWRSFANC